MPMLTKPAFGPRTAIIYITVGALIDVWTAVWYFAFARGEGGIITRNTQFWLWGLFLTGLTLIIIGVLLGQIGRAARRAELPPEDVVRDEAAIQERAAAQAHPAVAAGMVAPGMVAAAPAAMPAPVAPVAPPPPGVVRQ